MIVCFWCVFGVCVFELVCLCGVFRMFVGYMYVTFMFGVCVGLCVFCVMLMCILCCDCVEIIFNFFCVCEGVCVFTWTCVCVWVLCVLCCLCPCCVCGCVLV